MLQIFYFAKYVPSHTYLNFKGITLLPAMTWHKQFAEESWCHLTNIFSDFSKIFCNFINICCHKFLPMFRKDQKGFSSNKGLYDDQFGWMGVHRWKPQCGSFASKLKKQKFCFLRISVTLLHCRKSLSLWNQTLSPHIFCWLELFQVWWASFSIFTIISISFTIFPIHSSANPISHSEMMEIIRWESSGWKSYLNTSDQQFSEAWI